MLSLGLWIVGVQSHELLATVGLVFTVGLALTDAVMRVPPRLWWQAIGRWGRLGLFLIWALLSPFLVDKTPDPNSVARLLDWAALPFAVHALGLLTPLQKRRLFQAALLTFAVSATLAGLQHFGLWPEKEKMAFLSAFNVPYHRVYEGVRGDSDRFYGGGLLHHRLKFAHITGLFATLLIVVGLESSGRRRLMPLAVAGAGFLSILVFAQARGAALALGLSTLAVLAFWPLRHKRRIILSTILASLLALQLSPGIQNRVLHELFVLQTERPPTEREQLNAAGLNAIGHAPLTGSGWGRFSVRDYAEDTFYPSVLRHPGKAHNQLISLGAETGLIGLALFLLFVLGCIRRARSLGNGHRALSLFGWLGVLCLFHDPIFHAEMSMALVFALALLLTPRGAPSAAESGRGSA